MVNGKFKKRLLLKINSGSQSLRAGVNFARVKHLEIILKFCNLVFGIILNCQENLSFFQNGTIRGFH